MRSKILMAKTSLGQQMFNISTTQDWGTLSFFVLPGFRERTFPSVNGRLRSAIPVDTGPASFESSAEQWHVDYALRYSHYFGDWDVGLSHFYGTSREPTFVPNGNNSRLIPRYDLINQTGLDLQYTREAWLWKFEGIVREGQGKAFAATVLGAEYTLYQVFESNYDLGFLFEYQYDGRDQSAPATAADDDYFAGMRFTLNDISDTAILAGMSVDPSTEEIFYNFEAERRLGDSWQVELRARFFSGDINPTDFLAAFKKDSYLQLRLARYF